MITEKYLYFGANPASADGTGTSTTSMLFTNHADQTTLTLTTADFYNPIPTGTDVFTNGLMEVYLLNSHQDGGGDDHVFGTYYGTVADNTRVRIHPNALTYDGTNRIGIVTAATDAVYGITDSTDANENDYEVILVKPYIDNHAAVRPASKFLGARLKDNDETQLHFMAATNDAVSDDIITLKHGTDKFPEICRMMNDIVTDSRNQGEVVVVADLMNFDVASKSKFGVFVDNSAGILETSAGVAFNLDT